MLFKLKTILNIVKHNIVIRRTPCCITRRDFATGPQIMCVAASLHNSTHCIDYTTNYVKQLSISMYGEGSTNEKVIVNIMVF